MARIDAKGNPTGRDGQGAPAQNYWHDDWHSLAIQRGKSMCRHPKVILAEATLGKSDCWRLMLKPSSLLALLALVAAVPAVAGVENQVREMVMAGAILPFEPIRNHIVAQERGDYIGAEFDEATLTYRFRFLVDGVVKNVDVDARTGQRARKARNY